VNADCQFVSFQLRLQHKEPVTLTQSELTNRGWGCSTTRLERQRRRKVRHLWQKKMTNFT